VDTADTCAALRELQYARKTYIRHTTRIDNSVKAVVRRALGWRYDLPERERAAINRKAAALVEVIAEGGDMDAGSRAVAVACGAIVHTAKLSRQPFADARKETEKAMVAAARTLPAHAWQRTVAGFGELGLAVIVGEAGDIGNYAGPDKLKRRLCLAPFRGAAGSTWAVPSWRPHALTADDWTEAGYSGARLAQVFGVVTEPLYRAQSMRIDRETGEITRDAGPYRLIADAHKQRFLDRGETKMHAHRHGLRVMTQSLVIDLWRVWHGQDPRTSGHASVDTHWTIAASLAPCPC
jgi:hypothetical protein